MAAELYVLLLVLLAWEVGRLLFQIPRLCALGVWHSTLRAHLVPIAELGCCGAVCTQPHTDMSA